MSKTVYYNIFCTATYLASLEVPDEYFDENGEPKDEDELCEYLSYNNQFSTVIGELEHSGGELEVLPHDIVDIREKGE